MTDEHILLPIKRLDPTVELPSYAYSGDAGLDLRSSEEVTLAPHERRLVSTGLAIAIPEGYAGFVQPRSGLALREGLSMSVTRVYATQIFWYAAGFALLVGGFCPKLAALIRSIPSPVMSCGNVKAITPDSANGTASRA